MTDQPIGGGMSGDVTSDDKLWALLAYVLSPIVPVILLIWEEKKNRPFIRSHNVQALVLGLAAAVISSVVGGVTLGIGCCIGILPWIYQIYCGVQAYGGKSVTIPVITDFVKNQGWA
ncbi:MAG: DUF4870 domain-containing protein [Anaerolineales bacterium]|nr:DUF4870 domain-containing protein [Anaerolineales bacterium]